MWITLHPDDDPPGVIVLVPEIALTPQTAARFTRRFTGVAVLHSGLTASQRHQQWRRIARGHARIVVGARSAIFAPLPRLDLVIVDEEHDSSYKQDQLPRYHARDVGIKRAQMAEAMVVLGSATPSLESWYNAVGDDGLDPPADPSAPRFAPPRKPRYQLHQLPERVSGLSLPRVEIVDLVEERRARRGIHLLSERLEHELTATFEADRQAILLLNRRGYANWIACPDHRCGWQLMCDSCDAMMVYHKKADLPTGGYVRCHHCLAETRLPETCPDSGHNVTVFGLGTQRVEEEITRKFAGVKMQRMDSDVMRTSTDYHRALDAFRRGDTQLLLGTQMIAKGLDFPGVRLVGVVSGDTALHMPDFRASERTFQLIAQVAGRAGRAVDDKPGRVIVQSFQPDDPAINLAARHDFVTFARRELTVRRDIGLPPVTRLVRIVVRDRKLPDCRNRALELADQLQTTRDQLDAPVRIRGPMPCPIARIADHHRQQIELLAPSAHALQQLLTALRNAGELRSDAQTAIDVDPVQLL